LTKFEEFFEVVFEDHFREIGVGQALIAPDRFSRILGNWKCLMPGQLSPLDRWVGKKLWRRLLKNGWESEHVNKENFEIFLKLACLVERPSIVETGSSCRGVKSSHLFAKWSKYFGGSFVTIDNDPDVSGLVRSDLSTFFPKNQFEVIQGDSVEYLKNSGETYNVAYLDSYDLSPGSFNEAAEHGLSEFIQLVPRLDSAFSVILIDDTPVNEDIAVQMGLDKDQVSEYMLANRGRLPGKGSLVRDHIRGDHRFKLLRWNYQMLISYSDRVSSSP